MLENESGLPWYDAFMLAINEVLDNQVRIIAVPRRFTTDVRDIWALQQRLTRRQGKHPERAMEHLKFRAAFDFLLLRNRVERGLGELASWWERYVASNPDVRPQLQREATRRPASGERAPTPAAVMARSAAAMAATAVAPVAASRSRRSKDPPMIEVFVAIGSNLADPSARLVAPSPRWRPCPSQSCCRPPTFTAAAPWALRISRTTSMPWRALPLASALWRCWTSCSASSRHRGECARMSAGAPDPGSRSAAVR